MFTSSAHDPSHEWLPVGDGTAGEQTQRSYESLSEASDEDGESEDEDPSSSGDEDPDDSDVSELWRYREEEDDAEDYPFAALTAGGKGPSAESEDEDEDDCAWFYSILCRPIDAPSGGQCVVGRLSRLCFVELQVPMKKSSASTSHHQHHHICKNSGLVIRGI